MKTPTQRIYTNIETKERFRLFHDDITGSNDLRNELTGKIITCFYCAAFNGIDLKMKNGKIITLNAGEFMEVDFINIPIQKRYSGLQKRFSKL